jgi:UPF0755 protein
MTTHDDLDHVPGDEPLRSARSPYPDEPAPFAFGDDGGSMDDLGPFEFDDAPPPPRDLPPWYEDEYYDDEEWDRLPRRTSTTFRVVAFCSVLFVLLLIAYSQARGWVDNQLDPPGEAGEELTIEIPQGATTNDIARILGDNGVVANSTVFRYYLRFKDAPDFQAGIYTFQKNSAVWDVRSVLEAGPAPVLDTRVFVTVPEGFTIAEIRATLLDDLPLFDPDQLDAALAAADPPRVFADQTLANLEGVLFPETYDVDEATAANEQAFIDRMIAQFDIVATETGLTTPPEELGLTPYQVLIVASLIEEEAKVDGDRAKIARVIYNRLEQGMNLGIDATVVYALGGDRELSAEDLQVDSPYNTRRYPGLPPTPIAAPGRKSIEAALNPEPGDWLYYVLTDENGPGTHTFAVTDAEFQAAVRVCIERDLGCG